MPFFPIISIALAESAVVSYTTAHVDGTRFRMPVPPNQTTLVSPPNAPEYVTVGFGGQNYSCQYLLRYVVLDGLAISQPIPPNGFCTQYF